MMRAPISKSAVGRALSKTLDRYDQSPDFDHAFVIDTDDLQAMRETLWENLEKEYRRVGYELTES